MTRRDRWQSLVPAERHDRVALSGAALIASCDGASCLSSHAAGAIVAGYGAVSQITPLYTASGTLLYDTSEQARELQSILRADPITDAVMTTQAEVLRGMPLVEQVASRLNLHANAEFNSTLRPVTLPRRAMATARQWLARFIPGLAVAPGASMT